MRAVVFEGGVSRVSFCPRVCKLDLLYDIGRRGNINGGTCFDTHRRQQATNTDDSAEHSLYYIF
jgi:hypothetical protein